MSLSDDDRVEIAAGLFDEEKPIIIELRDGQEPIYHDFDGIAVKICPEGHLHELVFGDESALRAEEAVHRSNGDRVESFEIAAAQPMTGLSEDAATELLKVIRQTMGADIKQMAADIVANDNTPEAIRDHTARTMELFAAVESGEGEEDAVLLHLARGLVDEEYWDAYKVMLAAEDEREALAEILPYRTMLDAALAGVDTQGSHLVHGPLARPDIIEQALDELEDAD